MRLEVSTELPERLETPLMVVPLPADPSLAQQTGIGDAVGLDRATGSVLGQAVATGDFLGRDGDRVLAYRQGHRGPERVLFLGMGDLDSLSDDALRSVAGDAVRAAERFGLQSLGLCLSHLGVSVPPRWIQAAVEGLVLAPWRFRDLVSGKTALGESEPSIPLVQDAVIVSRPSSALDRNVRIGFAFATGENRARTLQAMPGNVATPSRLATEAERIADEAGLELAVLGPAEMEAESMGALLSVSRGSDEEPRLVILQHRGGDPDASPLVLVGKGLTFDAGGISIKPAKGMEDMKYDMSGGAAVLGAMLAIGKLDMPANVIGIVPSSENLLNGSATKPGDVVWSRAGKSIEVINTDAEGRLILADALDYAKAWNPAAIVDSATLTGASVIALGHHRSALLGNDSELMDELQAAGDRANQPCWPLPLDDEYMQQLKSDVADLKNVGGRPAGTITAACFLSEFAGSVPWAHLDIAGTAYGKSRKSYLRKGPKGTPCRLLLEWVRERAWF